jgi:hypothetical protein
VWFVFAMFHSCCFSGCLKKFVDAGKLADLGGSPKTYQLKG